MDRKFLEGLGLEKEAINKVLDTHGKDLETQKDLTKEATAARDQYKSQIEEATKTIESYKEMDVEAIKASAEEWKSKYEQDTAALKGDLEGMRYETLLDRKLAEITFSSNSAKEACKSKLVEQKLSAENDNLLGFDDYIKGYKEKDPGAFTAKEDGAARVNSGGKHEKQLDSSADPFVAAARAAAGLKE